MSFFNNKNGNNSGSSSPSTPEKVQTFISTANQTVFTLSSSYQRGENRLQVIVGGVRQFAPINFAETSATTFTLTESLIAGIEVVAIY